MDSFCGNNDRDFATDRSYRHSNVVADLANVYFGLRIRLVRAFFRRKKSAGDIYLPGLVTRGRFQNVVLHLDQKNKKLEVHLDSF